MNHITIDSISMQDGKITIYIPEITTREGGVIPKHLLYLSPESAEAIAMRILSLTILQEAE